MTPRTPIFDRPLPNRAARRAAKALRERGYSVTINECYKFTPKDIALHLETQPVIVDSLAVFIYHSAYSIKVDNE